MLPPGIKNEIKKITTVKNININVNNKKNLSKKLNGSSVRKKTLSSILNIYQSSSSSSKKNRNFFSQVFQTEIYNKNKNKLFNDNNELNIFSSNYDNYDHKQSKQIRYEEGKKNIFDIHKIQNLNNLQEIQNISQYIFSYEFIQKIFNDNIENVIECLSQLNKLINNLVSNNDIIIFEKIFDNLDILLRILYIKLTKYNDNNSLTKSFFIFLYSLIKLSKIENYIFTNIEIAILLNIICNKIVNNKEIISETAKNLILFLSNSCEIKPFIIILTKLLNNQNFQKIQEILKILQNLCEKSKYNTDIMSEIVDDIITIFFYNYKDEIILSLINKIYDSLGNKFWEKCKYLSKEKKDILSKNIFEYKRKNNENNNNNQVNSIYKNKNNYNVSSYKKEKGNNNASINNINKKISKIRYINNLKCEKIFNNNESKSNIYDDKNKLIKINKTTLNMKPFRTPTNSLTKLSKNSSNNISLEKQYISFFGKEEKNKNININKEKDNSNKLQEKNIENRLLKSLNLLNSSFAKDDIIIEAIITIYNIVYKNYNHNKDILIKNIDNIIESIIIKIEKAIGNNFKNELKAIKYLFNVINKLCTLDKFMNKISFKNYHKLFLVLISSFINKKINNIYDKNFEDMNEDKDIINDYKIIYKSINSSIIKLINSFDITNNIMALIIIIENNRINNKEIVEYAMRFLSFVTKIIKDKYLDLKINLIFNKIENLLDDIELNKEKDVLDINNNLSDNDSISFLMKSLVTEIVIHRKEYCFEYQKNIKNKYICKWIQDTIKMKNINNDKNNDFNKGFLFEGETFYPRVRDIIIQNNNYKNNNYSPEERIERNFKNIKNKWTKIQKNE